MRQYDDTDQAAKDVPRRPILGDMLGSHFPYPGPYTAWCCPSCGYVVSHEHENCGNCSQALIQPSGPPPNSRSFAKTLGRDSE